MPFIKLFPRHVRMGDILNKPERVKISFKKSSSSKNATILSIYISLDLATKLGWKPGDRIAWGYDDKDNMRWELTKHPGGWKLSKFKDQAHFFRIQLTWPHKTPQKTPVKLVMHEVTKDKRLLIYGDKADLE